MTALFPFMNARYQGMDIMYRTIKGQHGARLGRDTQSLGVRKARARSVIKFLGRSSLMISMTLAYYAMMRDDERYEALSDYERDMNWGIPIPGRTNLFLFPTPFELGTFLKLIPEKILAATLGDIEWDDAWKSIGEGFSSHMGGTLMGLPDPAAIQIVKPLEEISKNASFMTGRALFPVGYESMDPREMYNDYTTELAKSLSEGFGGYGGKWVSPIAIEQVIRGYTGTLGFYLLHLGDWAWRKFDPDMPGVVEKRWDEDPVVGRFISAPIGEGGLGLGRGYVQAMNKASAEADMILDRIDSLIDKGRHKEAGELLIEHEVIISMSRSYDKKKRYISDLRKYARYLKNLPEREMDPAEKQLALHAVTSKINMVAHLAKREYDMLRKS